MSDVRIICTHDAGRLAETVTRLLEAEEHRVRLTIGRQAMSELQSAREARDAVLLIWSPDARSQTYMLEWANKIEPIRLIELSLTEDPPKIARKASVIDFSRWRGERGSTQWNALNDRLRGVVRALNPPKPPPKYAALALGMASAAAVTGAIVLRINDVVEPAQVEANAEDVLIAADPNTGLGGPLNAAEPASLGDELNFRHMPNMTLLRATTAPTLSPIPAAVEIDLRNETLLERLNALNPLRDDPDTEQN